MTGRHEPQGASGLLLYLEPGAALKALLSSLNFPPSRVVYLPFTQEAV